MNRKIVLATLSTLLLILSGCATMNEDECRSADWYSVGFEDGASGRQVNYVRNHREACAEYGISPDAAAYQSGWAKGIRRFCTPTNGYRVGMHGSSVGVECPADQRRGFREAYQYGRQVYAANQELYSIEREMNQSKAELDQVQKQLQQIQHRMTSSMHQGAQQEHILAQLRQLYQREADLEAQLAQLDNGKRKDKDRKKPRTEPGKKRPGEGDDRDRRDDGRRDDNGRGDDRKDDNGRDDRERGRKEKDRDENGKEHGRYQQQYEARFGASAVQAQSSHRNTGNNRKQLERELARVRQDIHRLEAQLHSGGGQQQYWQMMQRSRELSMREGQLIGQLYMLERQYREQEFQVRMLKQRAPY